MRTLTLHLPKHGLRSSLAGALLLADLGIPRGVSRTVGVEPAGYGPGFVTRLERVLPLEPREPR